MPLGGINVTNDIAIGLKTNLAAAEQLKMRFGIGGRTRVGRGRRRVPVEVVDDGCRAARQRSEVTEIIDARMRELFEKIGERDRGTREPRIGCPPASS